ncbi:fumarylacetoacetate hydrolase family protein [Amorphus sp. 3PC139-8]|uniref:fumarylacetoacetate hydrolase family protein n=1 Tax=Amorphus sp. 3PC139-8 TaxID=2735676 RepID=UPI00345D053E
MKLVSYSWKGRSGYGIVKEDAIIDLASRVDDAPTLKALLATDGLDPITTVAEYASPDVRLSDVSFEPVITDPGKIICVGLNYHDHVAETGRSVTAHPTLFTRYPESQIGHGEPLVKPRESDKFDYEGELAVIIGKAGRRIAEADALSHVAGYSCYNDGSIRDWQGHTSQFFPGKNFVATGGFGPWMVTADEIPDPAALTLTTRLNGTVMQQATTDLLITPIPALISYISTVLPLEPGDVIVTGTPGGVGFKRQPPVYMKDGDVVEVEISGVGTLRNPVVAEA